MDVAVDLNYKPRPWQTILHQKRKRLTIAVCHRRAGKTWAAMHELLHCALSESNKNFCYVAPFLAQAKKVMWDPIVSKALLIPHTEIHVSELKITFPNGSTIWLFGADNSDGLRGQGMDGIIADEFQLWEQNVLPAVFLPMLAGRNGWLLELGTPTGIDPLTVSFDLAKADPEWTALLFDAENTGVLTTDELRLQRKNMTEALYRLEYMCQFDAGAPNQMITGDEVNAAMARSLRPEDYSHQARVMGCDIARQGDDRSVIARRQGFQCWDLESWQSSDLMYTVRRIKENYHLYKPDALFIDGGGIGAGVVDALRDMNVPIIEVQFGSKASDPRFMNLRSEIYYNMLHWIRRGGRLPNSPDLKLELTTPTHKTNDKGQLQLESKDDMKKRGMRSPDLADALAMTFTMPVSPQSVIDSADMRPKTDWNPF